MNKELLEPCPKCNNLGMYVRYWVIDFTNNTGYWSDEDGVGMRLMCICDCGAGAYWDIASKPILSREDKKEANAIGSPIGDEA